MVWPPPWVAKPGRSGLTRRASGAQRAPRPWSCTGTATAGRSRGARTLDGCHAAMNSPAWPRPLLLTPGRWGLTRRAVRVRRGVREAGPWSSTGTVRCGRFSPARLPHALPSSPAWLPPPAPTPGRWASLTGAPWSSTGTARCGRSSPARLPHALETGSPAVSATSPTNAWTVGTPITLVEHWDGKAWKVQPIIMKRPGRSRPLRRRRDLSY